MALDSIRANKLKAGLTLLSIAIGVFAIMGSGSLVNSIDHTLNSELEKMGKTTFYIARMPSMNFGNRSWMKYMKRKPITYKQYKELVRLMTSTNLISTIVEGSQYVIKNGDLETDPNVPLVATDDKIFQIMDYELDEGRFFIESDLLNEKNVAVVGPDVLVKIFPNQNPIGKKIKILNKEFEVIGTAKSRGSMFGQSRDNYVMITSPIFLKYYSDDEESLRLMIKGNSNMSLDESIDEAIGHLRTIRNVKPGDENNFEVETNDAISDQFSGITGFLGGFGFLSGGFALIAAGIGIMNIMLVSVKERTREIGIRKALGARRSWILMQFIIETITLCQVGGLIGILLGIVSSLALGKLLGLTLAFPTQWVIFSLVICTILGLAAGAYPAWKAAKLDPIEALRYE